MAAEGKIDPMHQFAIQPIAGSLQHGNPFVFTNSALWTLIVLGTIWLFMFGGMKRELIPGRWQVAAEGLIAFVDYDGERQHRPGGQEYLPWVFTAFIFLLFANFMGNMPFGVVPPAHPFTVTSQFTFTGVMSIITFAIVLGVGFWKHGLHFLSLFVPKDAPLIFKFFIAPIELISFRCDRSALDCGRSSRCSRVTSFWTSSVISSSRRFNTHVPAVLGSRSLLPVHHFREHDRAACRGDPGLRFRNPHFAVHRRGCKPSLTSPIFQRSSIMDVASAKVIAAGLAAIGVGAASARRRLVFGSFLQSAIRNPAAADGQQGRLGIGFAAAEICSA